MEEKKVNFKVKGTMDYEIAYEGVNLKIDIPNSDEVSLVNTFNALIRMRAIKDNMQSEGGRKNYSLRERKDIIITCRILQNIVEALTKRVYTNLIAASKEENKS